MNTIWKDIPGYEGMYQASIYGEIRSLDRKNVRKSKGGKIYNHSIRGKILQAGRYCKSGHLSVVLGRGTNGRPVHQLICLTFIGQCPEGLEVLHTDGNPLNNNLSNLRYGSRTENIIDVLRIGRSWKKLNLEQVKDIKRRLA